MKTMQDAIIFYFEEELPNRRLFSSNMDGSQVKEIVVQSMVDDLCQLATDNAAGREEVQQRHGERVVDDAGVDVDTGKYVGGGI